MSSLLVDQKKSRKKDIDEIRKIGKTEKLRKWVINHCGWCRQTGHNQRSCPSKKQGQEAVKVEISKKKEPELMEAEPTEPVEVEPAPMESQPWNLHLNLWKSNLLNNL
ncbi:hypothetical protein LIER_31720 [Lithospermum erythrorhizon]|uniref:CCHC-type domain-containing protein n=1 Tax=Lithospermum erythrorhizon TaxID=34254 RepID=A0AAV3RSU1_LITER